METLGAIYFLSISAMTSQLMMSQLILYDITAHFEAELIFNQS